MPAPIIDLREIHVALADKPVLRGASLAVGKGELVVVEGATGAGKTTLVRVLLGSQAVQSGSVRVLDTELPQASAATLTELRRRIGVVFQIPRFLEQESTLANVILPLAIAGESSRRSRAEGTRMLLDARLSALARKRPPQLSGGEQARLQIARALIHRPFLVLADEPFAHLDPDSTAAAEELLAAAHSKGATILITTHRPTSLLSRARRYLLSEGVLVG